MIGLAKINIKTQRLRLVIQSPSDVIERVGAVNLRLPRTQRYFDGASPPLWAATTACRLEPGYGSRVQGPVMRSCRYGTSRLGPPGRGVRLAPLISHSQATAPDPQHAALLLLCYAVGAGVPMLVIAYGGQWASLRVRRVARHLPALQRAFGVLVVGVAVAMFLQYDVLFTAWLSRFVPSISQGL